MSDQSNVSDGSNTGGITVGLYLSRGASAVMQACTGLPGLHVEAFADAAGLQAKVDAFDAVIIQNTAYDAGFAARPRRPAGCAGYRRQPPGPTHSSASACRSACC